MSDSKKSIVTVVEELNKKIDTIRSKRTRVEAERDVILRNLTNGIEAYEKKYEVSLKGKNAGEIFKLASAEYERVYAEVKAEYTLANKVVELIEQGNVKEAEKLLRGKSESSATEEGTATKKEEAPEKGSATSVEKEKESSAPVGREEKKKEEVSYVDRDDLDVDEDGFYSAPESSKIPDAEDLIEDEEGAFDEEDFEEDGFEEDDSDFDEDSDSDEGFDFEEEDSIENGVDLGGFAEEDDFGFDFSDDVEEKPEKKPESPSKQVDEPSSSFDDFSFDDDFDNDGSGFQFGKLLEGSQFEP